MSPPYRIVWEIFFYLPMQNNYLLTQYKTTMGNKLPRKLEQKMQTVGEQIRLARLRRDLSVAQVAGRYLQHTT